MSRHHLKPIILCLSAIWFSPSLWADTDENKEPSTTLSEIIVDGSKISRDEIGYSRVYVRDISNLYKGKQEIETYRGNSVSDLFSGMVGVYSGDSRNSGALDPNIRGIQGQGRIPVTVDGTEQSITVWRGYAGSNNRNYVDPNLISSVYIEKGPSMSRGVKSGIGGSVALKTLEIDDIVQAGQTFGLEVKAEVGNNAIKPLPNPYEKSVDYRTVGSPLDITGGMWRLYSGSGSDRQAQRFGGQGKYADKAIRIATGVKQDKFDALLVYAYRDKGNYFSGKRGGKKYNQLDKDCEKTLADKQRNGENILTCLDRLNHTSASPFVSYLARLYFPGGEVTNTSLHTESWLGKFNYHISPEQKIGTTLRLTDTRFGEIMPSRIGVSQQTYGMVLQWPESWVKQKAFNLDYQFNPKDNPWVDLKASLWTTHTSSKTNSAGGAPGDVLYYDNTMVFDEQILQIADMMWQMQANQLGVDINDNQVRCAAGFPSKQGCLENKGGRFNTIDGAAYYTKNNRIGFNVSNQMKLHKKLELLLAADFQHETLEGYNNFTEFLADPQRKIFGEQTVGFNTALDNIASSRNGKRHEYGLLFNFKYQPVDWLTLNVGAKYSGYKVQDNSILEFINTNKKWASQDTFRIITGQTIRLSNIVTHEQKFYHIPRDRYGRYRAEAFAEIPNWKAWANGTYALLYPHQDIPKVFLSRQELMDKIKNKKANGWAPQLSATFNLGNNGRLYVRYAEHLRWPSIFEATSGFAVYMNDNYEPDLARAYFDFLPEHAKNWEIGYVHNFTHLIPKARYADARINYYHNTTKNVMDRDRHYLITQYDKRIQTGIELQTRFDFGRIFGDLSVVRTLKTKTCDKAWALAESIMRKRDIPECWDGGLDGTGYLAYMVQPRWSVTGNLGLRLLNNQLELGSRITYHSRVRDSYDAFYKKHVNPNDTSLSGSAWQPVFLVDAYVRYKMNKNLTLELSGTNLTDRYYQDPINKTMMAGPGRTLKLSITGKF